MKLNAFWTGSDLSYVEQLCLSSAVAVGHSVDLWTYVPISNVPAGVTLRDARQVMPESKIIWNRRKNSPGLGSDIFRLTLQKQRFGCYTDCDLLFLKPIVDADYIFGLDGPNYVNNAVLKLPADCPIIDANLNLIEAKPIVPPWWPLRRRVRQRLKALIGLDMKSDNFPWSTLGPTALSYFAKQYGLIDLALPTDVFYPNPFRLASAAFEPSSACRERITDRTVAVHLWNNRIGAFKEAPPPPGSLIHEYCLKLGVAYSTPTNSPSALTAAAAQ
jgi:hypothetical protein